MLYKQHEIKQTKRINLLLMKLLLIYQHYINVSVTSCPLQSQLKLKSAISYLLQKGYVFLALVGWFVWFVC